MNEGFLQASTVPWACATAMMSVATFSITLSPFELQLTNAVFSAPGVSVTIEPSHWFFFFRELWPASVGSSITAGETNNYQPLVGAI
jgi:hypothetical protein